MTSLKETIAALAGLKVDGEFLGMAICFTEMQAGDGYGGTFAVPLEGLSLESIAEARMEHLARFSQQPTLG